MPMTAMAIIAINGTRDRVMPRAPASFIVDSLSYVNVHIEFGRQRQGW
jgi:hypothetical protein